VAVSANRSVIIKLTGDVISSDEYSAAENVTSPGSITIHALVGGNNTISVPTVTGFTVKAATIIPPSDNTSALTLKGIGGDTGILISKTDPTSLGFDAAPASFVINSASNVNGLRIVWN